MRVDTNEGALGAESRSRGQNVFDRFLPDADDPVAELQVLLVAERLPHHAGHFRTVCLGTQQNDDAPHRQIVPQVQQNIISQDAPGKISVVTDLQFPEQG